MNNDRICPFCKIKMNDITFIVGYLELYERPNKLYGMYRMYECQQCGLLLYFKHRGGGYSLHPKPTSYMRSSRPIRKTKELEEILNKYIQKEKRKLKDERQE